MLRQGLNLLLRKPVFAQEILDATMVGAYIKLQHAK